MSQQSINLSQSMTVYSWVNVHFLFADSYISAYGLTADVLPGQQTRELKFMGYVLVTETLKLVYLRVPFNIFLYNFFVLPHLEYCSPLSLGVGKVQVVLRTITITLILKSILGYGKTISYEELLGRDCEHENSRTQENMQFAFVIL